MSEKIPIEPQIVEYMVDCMFCENKSSVKEFDTYEGNLKADRVFEGDGWWYVDGAWICPKCQGDAHNE